MSADALRGAMAGRSMVFHHPAPVASSASRGSGIRPAKMLASFRDLGFEIEEVTGYSRDRHRASRRLRADVASGRRFDFVYAESATTPHALTDPRHLPARPLVDARFFASMQRSGIPVGLFYRDIYWRFEDYDRAVPPLKRLVAKLFYRFDLLTYAYVLDTLFLPSIQMAEEIPSRRNYRLVALPPGSDIDPVAETNRRFGGDCLELLYVGGVRPPLYDLRPVLDVVRHQANVHLTICCRAEEADSLPALPPNCTVVHEHGVALSARYRRADLALVVFGSHPYRRFAVPIKLFEAVGHGVPTIADAETAAGIAVRADGLGLTVQGTAGLKETIERLVMDPEAVDVLRRELLERRGQHTWTHRAMQVVDALARPA